MGKRLVVHRGDTYGFLTVIREAEPCETSSGRKLRRMSCECRCGKHVMVHLSNLVGRPNPSCGCIQQKAFAKRYAPTTHGMSRHPLYDIWKSMLRRCNDTTQRNYSRYGGRGIRVCNEWNDVKTFIAWALENGWERGLQIDRRDNDGDYEPGNCRFVTQIENMRNTRHNHLITFNGETMCLSAWADRLGMNVVTLSGRLNTNNWSVERALTQQVRHPRGRAAGFLTRKGERNARAL